MVRLQHYILIGTLGLNWCVNHDIKTIDNITYRNQNIPVGYIIYIKTQKLCNKQYWNLYQEVLKEVQLYSMARYNSGQYANDPV